MPGEGRRFGCMRRVNADSPKSLLMKPIALPSPVLVRRCRLHRAGPESRPHIRRIPYGYQCEVDHTPRQSRGRALLLRRMQRHDAGSHSRRSTGSRHKMPRYIQKMYNQGGTRRVYRPAWKRADDTSSRDSLRLKRAERQRCWVRSAISPQPCATSITDTAWTC